MASSLAGSVQIEPALMMCPRYSTDYCRKAHFYSLAQRFVMKVLEDYVEMGKMVAKQLTEHQDIIQVYDHKAVKKVKKNLIHQMLKGRGCVGQSKGHNNPL